MPGQSLPRAPPIDILGSFPRYVGNAPPVLITRSIERAKGGINWWKVMIDEVLRVRRSHATVDFRKLEAYYCAAHPS